MEHMPCPHRAATPSRNAIWLNWNTANHDEHQILNHLSLQTKLEEALHLAMDFHNSLQDFINWLTQAEQTLNVASRPSLILDTILFQIDEHKVRGNSDGKRLTSRDQSAFLSEASI